MIDILAVGSILFLILGLLFSILRFIRGPDPVDRVICLDFIALSAAALIAVHALWSQEKMILDTIVILSIIAFFSTTIFARYIEARSGE